MSLYAALSEFCVEIIGPPRSKMSQVIRRLIMVLESLLLQLLPLLLEVSQLFLLQYISEFLPNELQLLLIEYIDMLIDVIVEPGVI